MMKLFFLLLSFFGFSHGSSTSTDQSDSDNKGKDVPSPTIYNDADGHYRGGWDGN